MKRFLLVFLLLPIICPAQNFEVGLNGGCSFHSLPMNNIHTEVDKAKLSYAAGFKGDLLLPHAQIGVGIEMVELAEFNYLIAPYTMRIYNYIAKPLVAPNIFYNRVITLASGYCYGGLTVGPAIARVGVDTYQGTPNYTGYSTAYNSVTGLMGGIQLGFVLDLNKKLGLNAEAAGRFMSINYKDPTNTVSDNPYRYRLFYFPMTLGIRYKI